MSSTQQPPPAERFASLIAALCAALGTRVTRPGKPGLPGALLIAIWNRLARMAARVTKLAARVEAGTLKPPRKRPAGSRRTPAKPKPAEIKLPRHFAWLLPLVPGIAFGKGHLQVLLDDPEMQALIAAAPQIGRTLRPLCHMLGLRPPPTLQLPPPAPPPPRKAKAARTPPAGPSRAEPPRPPRPPPARKIARRACGPPLPA